LIGNYEGGIACRPHDALFSKLQMSFGMTCLFESFLSAGCLTSFASDRSFGKHIQHGFGGTVIGESSSSIISSADTTGDIVNDNKEVGAWAVGKISHVSLTKTLHPNI